MISYPSGSYRARLGRCCQHASADSTNRTQFTIVRPLNLDVSLGKEVACSSRFKSQRRKRHSLWMPGIWPSLGYPSLEDTGFALYVGENAFPHNL